MALRICTRLQTSPPPWLWVTISVLVMVASAWNLGTSGWNVDEVVYRDAGQAYIEHGDYAQNIGHPLLAKLAIGASMDLFGSSATAVRLPSVVATLVTAAALAALAWVMAGQWGGLMTLSMWGLLPWAPGSIELRAGRYGLLEPWMIAFGAGALLAGWWFGRTGKARFAVAAGVALGCSMGSKLPGVLLLPAVVLPVLWAPVRARWQRPAYAAAVTVVAIGCWLASYLPAGSLAGEAIRQTFENQLAHNDEGHAQLVAGTVYLWPPWWSNLWWMAQELGLIGLLALGCCAIGVLAKRDRRIWAWSAASVLVPFVVISTAGIKQPHYHLVMVAPLCVTAGVGMVILVSRPGSTRISTPVVAAGAGAVLAILSIVTLGRTLTLEPSNYKAAASALQRAGLDREPIALWGWGSVLLSELPSGSVWEQAPAVDAVPAVVVIDPVTADRQRGTAWDTWITTHRPDYYSRTFGRIEVLTLVELDP